MNLTTLYQNYDKSSHLFFPSHPIKPKNHVQPMNYSKSRREQLICADMSSAIVIVYLDMATIEHDPEVLYLVRQMRKRLAVIYEFLYGNGELRLKPGPLKRYQKSMLQIQNLVSEAWGDDAGLSLDFISAVLQTTIDMIDQMKTKAVNSRYFKAWKDLVENLQKVYEFYDEDLKMEGCIERGSKFADQLWRVIQES